MFVTRTHIILYHYIYHYLMNKWHIALKILYAYFRRCHIALLIVLSMQRVEAVFNSKHMWSNLLVQIATENVQT